MNIKNDMAKRILVMSPLADPVVSAMFANKETSGLAIVSLINAVLEEDGETIQIENIISVTPQRQHGDPGQRGCRIDIEVSTTNKERIIIEVQMSPESWIMQRNLFSASRIFTETSVPGDNARDMADKLPKIIVINILNYSLRSDNQEVIQPAKIMFTKVPVRLAVPNLSIYNVQLPMITEVKEDFSRAWYCWFYALYKADRENKTLTEVINMTPQLQAYSKKDAGFRQYCEQYGRVASDPEAREEYYWWVEGLMKEAGMKHAAEEIFKQKVREAQEGMREAQEGMREAQEELRETQEKTREALAEVQQWRSELVAINSELAEKDASIAEKDALIAELLAKINKSE